MGRNETEKKNEGLSSIKKRDETNEKSERKPYTSRRGRPSRSSTRSATPPKKKHRPDDPSSAKEGEASTVKKVLRPGVPKETERKELEFPDRYSGPKRPDSDQGVFRYISGENITPRYKIMSKLGEGTFGLVLECWDRVTKMYVAMKIIRNVEKYRIAAMLELEALNTVKVNDPNSKNHCIPIDKWFTYRGHVCLVFEKLGPSVYDFLKKNNFHPFDVDLIREIAYQLLQAVAYLHDLKLSHTDLKPENILFCKDGSGLRMPQDSRITVIDFGSATFETSHHGRIVSTRHYRAPEVVLGTKWNHECDLWSVGCILVEMMTGETLFSTHEDMEHLAMMEQVLGPIPKSLAERVAEDSKKLFRDDHRLNWPDGASSRTSIRNVRRLLPLRQWIGDVGDRSVKPYLEEFVHLVASLMAFEPSERISAKEALHHRFFDPLSSRKQTF